MSMSDGELIAAVCDLWHQNGGDACGFGWNARVIQEELQRRERIAEREWKRPSELANGADDDAV